MIHLEKLINDGTTEASPRPQPAVPQYTDNNNDATTIIIIALGINKKLTSLQ